MEWLITTKEIMEEWNWFPPDNKEIYDYYNDYSQLILRVNKKENPWGKYHEKILIVIQLVMGCGNMQANSH